MPYDMLPFFLTLKRPGCRGCFFFFEILFLIGSNYKGPQGGPGGGGGGQQPGENLGEAGSPAVPTTLTCHPHPYKWKCKWRKVPDPLNNPKKP